MRRTRDLYFYRYKFVYEELEVFLEVTKNIALRVVASRSVEELWRRFRRTRCLHQQVDPKYLRPHFFLLISSKLI